jgi:glutamate-1-semialdehyde aminotransferase
MQSSDFLRETDALRAGMPGVVLDQLVRITATLLRKDLQEIDIREPFTEMGADAIGMEVSMRRLFENENSVQSLAAYIESAQAVEGVDSVKKRSADVAGPAAAAPFIPFKPIQPGDIAAPSISEQEKNRQLMERYTAKTGTSRRLTEKYRLRLADNRASAGFRLSIKEMLYPIHAERSAGSKIFDVDGNEFLDFTMGFGANLFGHNPAFVMDAVRKQLELGLQLGPQSPLAGEVAELVAGFTGMDRVTFCNSGTEAVMTALRLARTATGRPKIALFAGSYHGTFDGVLARTGDKTSQVLPLSPGVPPHMIDDVVVLDYETPGALETIRRHAGELAAVLVEPVQSRRPEMQPALFLRNLRALTREHGIALIFDEIITGFRLAPGGAQEWFDVRADLATYGKVIGGGLPIGLVAGRAEYLDGIDGGQWSYGDESYPSANTTFFAGTFCKHPLTMAASKAVLLHMKDRGPALQKDLNRRTSELAARLNEVFAVEQFPVRVAHCGSLFRFAFGGNMDLFFYQLLDRGIYIWEGRTCFLSTAHTDADVDRLIAAVRESVREMKKTGLKMGRP